MRQEDLGKVYVQDCAARHTQSKCLQCRICPLSPLACIQTSDSNRSVKASFNLYALHVASGFLLLPSGPVPLHRLSATLPQHPRPFMTGENMEKIKLCFHPNCTKPPRCQCLCNRGVPYQGLKTAKAGKFGVWTAVVSSIMQRSSFKSQSAPRKLKRTGVATPYYRASVELDRQPRLQPVLVQGTVLAGPPSESCRRRVSFESCFR